MNYTKEQLKAIEAAAPMMYEACQSALALLKDQYNIVLGQYPKYGKFPEIILLEKALTKAEGIRRSNVS